MPLDRRAFLASCLALPFGGKILELLAPEPELENLRLVRYTSRLEITEEARAALEAGGPREDHLVMSEGVYEELARTMKEAFESDIIESVADAPPDFLAPASSDGRYFDTSHLYASS